MSTMEEIVADNSDVAERVRELVQGIIITDDRLVPLQTQYDLTTTQAMINLLAKLLVDVARSAVRDIEPTNDLKFLRVITKKCEYIVAPEREFTIIIVQSFSDTKGLKSS